MMYDVSVSTYIYTVIATASCLHVRLYLIVSITSTIIHPVNRTIHLYIRTEIYARGNPTDAIPALYPRNTMLVGMRFRRLVLAVATRQKSEAC